MKVFETWRQRAAISAAFFAILGSVFSPLHAQTITFANPDFEIYQTCPATFNRSHINNISGGVVVSGWIHPTVGSADYYNTCGYRYQSPLNPPPGAFAQSGSGYIGIYAEGGGSDYKEYIQTPMSTPMLAGVTYSITFYVKGGDVLGAGASLISDLQPFERGFLGLMFSATPPDRNSTTDLAYGSITNNFPGGKTLIPSSSPIYTNKTWTLVTLTYTATGGEQYMTVGQFRPGQGFRSSYFLLDNFSIIAATGNDLRVVKVANLPSLRTGEVVTYALTATNDGPSGANNAVLRDVPGAGLDCTEAGLPAPTCTAAGGASCPTPLTAAGLIGAGLPIPLMPNGGSVTATLACRVTATGTP